MGSEVSGPAGGAKSALTFGKYRSMLLCMAMSMSDRVRKAIEGCGMSRYRLSKVTGVSEAMLSRFVRGERNLTLVMLEKLAPSIGVKLVIDKPKRSRSK